MTTDIKVKIRDIEGLQNRVTYTDQLRNDLELGPFTLVTGVVTDSLSVGYPYQVMDPSFNLDVKGSLRVTEDALVLYNMSVNKQLFVNEITTLNASCIVNGDTYLYKTLNVSGNTSLSQLKVNGSSIFQSNVSVIGDTNLNKLNVTGETTMIGNLLIENVLRIGIGGSIIYDNPISIQDNNIINSTQLNISNYGIGPALRVNQIDPTFSDILLLESNNRDIYTVGNNGNTQILGKIRIGYDVISTNASVNNNLYDTTSDVTPFRNYQLDISGNTYNSNNMTIDGNMNISGTTYMKGLLTLENELTSYSDIRIKKNVTQLEHCLDKITDIRGYKYQRIDRQDPKYFIGLIAQEIEVSFPELVTEINISGQLIKTVHYQAFSGVLLECIQELKEKIIRLENKIFK